MSAGRRTIKLSKVNAFYLAISLILELRTASATYLHYLARYSQPTEGIHM